MVEQSEGWFTLKDGTKLYTKTWEPTSTPVAHLIALHGFSDHINAYYKLFPILSSEYNIKIFGFDQRGWGRSASTQSQWGLTGPTTEVIDDIDQFAQHVVSTGSPSTPLFIFGHSMGGGEALTYLLKLAHGQAQYQTRLSTTKLPDFAGIVLEAPYIALPPSSQPSSMLVVSGRLAAKLLPNHQMKQKLAPSAMSRDPKVCEDWANDRLCHDTGTLRGLAGLLDRAATLDDVGKDSGHIKGSQELVKLPCPSFWAHGDDDKVCSFEASQRLFNALFSDADSEQKTLSEFKTYKGAYHKLHAEPDGVGEQFARDVGTWIVGIATRSRAKAEPTQVAAPESTAADSSKPSEIENNGNAGEYVETGKSRL